MPGKNSAMPGKESDANVFRPNQKSFRVRYQIICKPKNYRYHVIEERWCNNGNLFDCCKEFWLPAHLVKQITGFVPSHSHQDRKIMWILLPYVILFDNKSAEFTSKDKTSEVNHQKTMNKKRCLGSSENYRSPLLWWLTFDDPGQLLPRDYYTTPSTLTKPGEADLEGKHHRHTDRGASSSSFQYTRRPFSYRILRYFPDPGESVTNQANRLLGRFRGSQWNGTRFPFFFGSNVCFFFGEARGRVGQEHLMFF